MRSADVQQPGMFAYVSVEDRVPSEHPIRELRLLVDTILGELDGVLAERYACVGRSSIPPERLLRAALLQVVYSVRSERRLMEQLNYSLLFRGLVGLNIDDPVMAGRFEIISGGRFGSITGGRFEGGIGGGFDRNT